MHGFATGGHANGTRFAPRRHDRRIQNDLRDGLSVGPFAAKLRNRKKSDATS